MANKHTSLKALFTDIADAIRGKTGDTGQIVADDFPKAISEIETDRTEDEDGIITGDIATYVNDRVRSVGRFAFSARKLLKSISLPSCEELNANCFDSCSALSSVDLPKVATISVEAFVDCVSLKEIDLPKVTWIGDGAFWRVPLEKLILRRTDARVAVGITVFGLDETPPPNLIAYVPSALVEEYKRAPLSRLAKEIRALEDYTVDGTVDGELDESKI